MDAVIQFLHKGVAGIELLDILYAILAILVGFVAGRLFHRAVAGVLTKLPEFTVRHALVEAVQLPGLWTLRGVGLWAALSLLDLPNVGFDLQSFLNSTYQGATIGLATWLGVRLVSSLTALWAHRAGETEGTYDDQLVPIVRKTAKVFMVAVGSVMVLQNLGYSVGSLLAGLGIGGAAIAFASKDTIANFFGSVVVFVDRPFQVGDWVEIGDVEGTVEEVDIRTTRIRTFANSLIFVPNSFMTVNAIENWSAMGKRRIKLNLGVTYDATPEQLRAGVAAIRDIIEKDERFKQDFSLVNFHDFGDSSLSIFVYLFTVTTNWAEYMQIREDFLLMIMDRFKELGLEFAFPTQTVHLAGGNKPPGLPSLSRAPGSPTSRAP